MCNKFSALFLLLFLCSCSVLRYHKPLNVEIADGVKFKLINLAIINQNISQKQRVHGSFEELFFNVTIATNLTPHSLEIIGIAPVMGTRIFTLKYDNKTIAVEHSKLIEVDPRIKPEYIIADTQLIYADIAEIKKNLDKEVKISEGKKDKKWQRIFSKNSKPFIEITYDSNVSALPERLKSNIRYKHFQRHYDFFIVHPK